MVLTISLSSHAKYLYLCTNMYTHSHFLLYAGVKQKFSEEAVYVLNILQTDMPDTNTCGCEELIATDLERQPKLPWVKAFNHQTLLLSFMFTK